MSPFQPASRAVDALRHDPASALFESLERRDLLSPTITDVAFSSDAVYPGMTITITARATAPGGIRGVSFQVQDSNGSIGYPLGDRFIPDPGTTDQYTLTTVVTSLWGSGPYVGSTVIKVDAVDQNGIWATQPVRRGIRNAHKPFVLDLRALPLNNGDIQLTAYTSFDGEHVSGTLGAQPFGLSIRGVTFFLDQNGNNQWDAGTDIDLGAVRSGANGVYQLTITPQTGWNLSWFAASAFDSRSSTDNFGGNRLGILRADDSPPIMNSAEIVVLGNYPPMRVGANLQLTVPVTAFKFLAATLFHDRNGNGHWDAGVDTHIADTRQLVNGAAEFTFQALAAYGRGWRAFGIAIKDDSGRGDHAWSSVRSLWLDLNIPPWIDHAVVTQNPAPRNGPVNITFDAFDDEAVYTFREAFIDFNNNGVRDSGDTSVDTYSREGYGTQRQSWQMSFRPPTLQPGTYSIHLWLMDSDFVTGPRTVLQFTVV